MAGGWVGEMALEIHSASAGYDGRPVLHDVSLSVADGECVAVMGRSGAGKSTLLGLLYDKSPMDVALIPQAAALVKSLSVFHNVYMGRLDRHSTAHNLRTLVWPRADDMAHVSDVLSDVGLAEKIRAQAGALSGGQQQRVSVARAIYNGRPILIGDEPVSALDGVQGAEILRLLRSRFKTLILALHDVGLALEHADRIVVLEAGRIVIDQPSSALSARDLLGHFGGQPT
jgi:phosphonate transport system ATP-binding protein